MTPAEYTELMERAELRKTLCHLSVKDYQMVLSLLSQAYEDGFNAGIPLKMVEVDLKYEQRKV